MSDYKSELTRSMDYLAQDPLVRFVGYGVKFGKAMGTLNNVPESQLVEMPVAENLMCGAATGMALKGLKPVVFIERFDFILNALDAIVNHLDKLGEISNEEYKPAVLFRVVVGNRNKPLFTGETHTQDFSEAIRRMVGFPVHRLMNTAGIFECYKAAHAFMAQGRSTMLVEYKDQM
jgi:pyruvate/2-oxoglutarate/acetoin dehydrogenase E1 component